ncbi:TPA: hypothetical protein ACGXMH_001323 [Bacillus mobilis]|nr:hypothetical protein [Bacillus mobilis]MED4384983.1 hypothetical protein [Bacillus mobilis]
MQEDAYNKENKNSEYLSEDIIEGYKIDKYGLVSKITYKDKE